MIIFIDFDDVLFDARSFVDDLKKIFLDCGISEDLFGKYYHDENKRYNPEKQIKRIQEDIGKDLSELSERLNDFTRNLEDYVFDDFEKFSEKIGKENIYILSFGDVEFQKLKIKNSGVGANVKNTIIATGEKSKQLKKFLSENPNLKKEDLYFIDDKVSHVEDIKKNFPEIKTILIHRSKGRYHEKSNKFCDYEAYNLKEINNIIIAS